MSDVAGPPEATKTTVDERVAEIVDVNVELNPGTAIDALRVTFPLNPLMLLIVKVLLEELPRGILKNVGLDESEKSGLVTMTKIDMNRVRLPLVPRTLRYEDCETAVGLAETVSVTVAEPPLVSVTLRLLNVALTPEKNPRVERVTVPLNPLKLVRVIVD